MDDEKKPARDVPEGQAPLSEDPFFDNTEKVSAYIDERENDATLANELYAERAKRLKKELDLKKKSNDIINFIVLMLILLGVVALAIAFIYFANP